MKRKEMEKLIENTILNTMGTDPDTGVPLIPTQGFLGYSVLKAIEEAGMLPPSYIKKKKPCDDVELTNEYQRYYCCNEHHYYPRGIDVFEWEPEDET